MTKRPDGVIHERKLDVPARLAERSVSDPVLAFHQALKEGDLEALHTLAPHIPRLWFPPDHDALKTSAARGHLAALQYVETMPQAAANWAEVIQDAARGGHLATVQWLLPRSILTAVEGALVVAAERGHMDVVSTLAPHVPSEWATKVLVSHWPAQPQLLAALAPRLQWNTPLQRFVLDCAAAGNASAVQALLAAFPRDSITLHAAGRSAVGSPLDDDTALALVRRCGTPEDSPWDHEPLVHALGEAIRLPHRRGLVGRLCQEVPAPWPTADMAEVWMLATILDAPDDTVRELVKHASAAEIGAQWLADNIDIPFDAFERFAPWIGNDDVRIWVSLLETAAHERTLENGLDRVPAIVQRLDVLLRHDSASERTPKGLRSRARP